jgi:uncharacterized protein (TIGR02302 family)
LLEDALAKAQSCDVWVFANGAVCGCCNHVKISGLKLETLLFERSPKKPTSGASDPAARLQLSKAVQRAQLAVAWERLWPHLARILTLAGFFLAVSWIGAWVTLPLAARVIGLLIFATLLIAALLPLIWFRWPTRAEALLRLDRGSGIRHRPATTLTDTLANQDPVARALWQAQRERTLASIKRIRAGLPTPRLSIHDPWAIRALVVVLAVATFIAAGPERAERVTAAFDLNGALAGTDVRLDAWITPPAYTGRPPIVLTGGNSNGSNTASADNATFAVPAGSILIVRTSSGSLDVSVSGGIAEAGPGDKEPPAGTEERRFKIASDGTAQIRSPASRPKWRFTAAADQPPSISLAKDPERQARGALALSYKLVDDYGVSEAHAQFQLQKPSADQAAPNGASDANAAAPRPLFDAPQFQLVLPNARTRNGVGQTVKDLSDNPYAGADVTLTLTAKDEAGNEGRSDPFDMRLPERLFVKPLARALVEQRRILALDANKAPVIKDTIDAMLIEPEVFMPEIGQYLGLRDIDDQISRAKTDDQLREVVASLWALAVLIEDGDITDVDKALRAAQDALRQALDRGASDDEIKKLTEQLRAALDKFLQQLTEQMKNNPQQLARPLDKNARVLSEQDLKNMIDRMERLARSGDRDAARQLLEQLQSMLENLQMAQPGQGGNDLQDELGDVIRKQQQLRDKTFRQGQDSRRDRMRGQRGDQNAMNDLQRDQQGLRDRLRKLLDDLARQGMMPKGNEQGGDDQADQDQGPMGQIDQGEDSLSDADKAMDDAGSKLGDGDADSAVDSQGRALESLRKGAQRLAQQMQEGDDDGNGPSDRRGRQAGNAPPRNDPLGRGYRDSDYPDQTVQIPGEIDVQRARRILEELRRRLGETNRPQVELDYIERLLKDY